MIKPKYIENILSITKEKRDEIECDVVCVCGERRFIGYKNVIVRSEQEKEYEKEFDAFCKKYKRIRMGRENGVSYVYGMKGLFEEEVLEKFEYKRLDATEIVKVKCAACGKEYILFDSRFHGYDAMIPERISKYDDCTYTFAPVKWRQDTDGIATFTVRIQNDESLEDFIENAYETDEETYSNSFGWIIIKAVNVKTKVNKVLIDLETQ